MIVVVALTDVLLLLVLSAAFSVVDARNVEVVTEKEPLERNADDENVLWCVEKATAEEHDALRRRAAESMLLENFMLTRTTTIVEGVCLNR